MPLKTTFPSASSNAGPSATMLSTVTSSTPPSAVTRITSPGRMLGV
jgi:hypothetical protein